MHECPLFGAIRTELGNLCLRKTAWWGWEDSNLQPNDYSPLALSRATGPLEEPPSERLACLEITRLVMISDAFITLSLDRS